jgi:UDP-2-acetamido-3-amino-2,3-dideoxy-glucuronate N-acetyltransferase
VQAPTNNDVLSQDIGPGSKIWQYTVVLPGAKIGKDCNVNAHCFVENNVRVGDRVTVKCGVYLWDGTVVEDDVFIGPNATFVNDLLPRSKHHGKVIPQTILRKGCSIGANATILAGRTIGRYAMVGANTLVTKDVPPFALTYGSPGLIQGYVCKCGAKIPSTLTCASCGRSYFNSPRGELQDRDDMKLLRGKHINMRLVEKTDAKFIVTLRSYAKSRKFLSATSTSIEAQEQWLSEYKTREDKGREFYYVIELHDGTQVGLIRIYDLEKDIFSGGSWIIAPGQPHRIAVETVVLLYDLCFDQLGYTKVLLQVIRENQSVIKFHQRFGAKLDWEDEKYVYLTNTYQSMAGPRSKFKALLGWHN